MRRLSEQRYGEARALPKMRDKGLRWTKGLPYCFACSDFPCKFIKNLEKSYNKRYQASLIENSRFVQRHGLDMFMQTQKETYTCSKCGGIISVHDGACSECREKAT